jgi:hypothetical protein
MPERAPAANRAPVAVSSAATDTVPAGNARLSRRTAVRAALAGSGALLDGRRVGVGVGVGVDVRGGAGVVGADVVTVGLVCRCARLGAVELQAATDVIATTASAAANSDRGWVASSAMSTPECRRAQRTSSSWLETA